MAANTPHVVFDDVARDSPIPLLSIVETCAREAQRRGLKRVGLLGTGFTMDSSMYPDVFRPLAIAVHVPDAEGRSWLHDRYIGQLLKGVFTDETRAGVGKLVEQMVRGSDIDGVVLAGTELPLLIKADSVCGLPLLDTTELHVRAIVTELQRAS